VCVCVVYGCVCMYIYKGIYVCVNVYIYMYMCIYIYIYIFISSVFCCCCYFLLFYLVLYLVIGQDGKVILIHTPFQLVAAMHLTVVGQPQINTNEEETDPTTPPAGIFSMAMEAWYMDSSEEDQRKPHRLNPNEPVSLDQLKKLGVFYWKVRGRPGVTPLLVFKPTGFPARACVVFS